MTFELRKVLKALLFSASEPLAVKDVQTVITRYHQQLALAHETAGEDEQAVLRDVLQQVPSLLTGSQIRECLHAIGAELDEAHEPWQLQETHNGWRLAVRPQFADFVRLLRDEPRPQRLSASLMETLAVVAYRQPVTRTEVEAIRGVACDRPLSKLIELELVWVKGRADLPGRPLQYATAPKFLEFTGLRSLDELPSSDVLSPAQLSEWIRQATAPQPDFRDEQMGLPLG